MVCRNCSRDNPETNKFCNACGESLATRDIERPLVSEFVPPAPPPPPPKHQFVPPAQAVIEVFTKPIDFAVADAKSNAPLSGLASDEDFPLSNGNRTTGQKPRSPTRRNYKTVYAPAVAIGILLVVGFLGFAFWISPSKTSVLPANPSTVEEPKAEVGPLVPPVGMAYVPGGEFVMGTHTGDKYSRPAHRASVQPFFIDLTEVTNEDYKKFVDATGHRAPPIWRDGAFPGAEARHPVTGVDWDDANAYATWVGKRLPTEAEWEFAARGADNRKYPWGNDWNSALANAGVQLSGLRDVGQGGESPFGLFDMSGNAWEWTASDANAYPGGSDFPFKSPGAKVIRGGSWENPKNEATAEIRAAYGPRGEKDGYNNTGFRCVRQVH